MYIYDVYIYIRKHTCIHTYTGRPVHNMCKNYVNVSVNCKLCIRRNTGRACTAVFKGGWREHLQMAYIEQAIAINVVIFAINVVGQRRNDPRIIAVIDEEPLDR